MSRRLTCVLTLAVLATAATAFAQGPGGRGGRGFGRFGGGLGANVEGGWVLQAAGLVRSEAVQAELGIDAAKAEEIAEASRPGGRGQGGGFGGGGGGFDPEAFAQRMKERAEALKATLDASLTEAQVARLHQIQRQVAGPMAALASPDDAAALEVTDEQKSQVEELQASLGEDLRDLFGQIQDGLLSREEMGAKTAELQNAANEKAAALLTEAQQAKWKELTGDAFAAVDEVRAETRRGPRGGGRRGGGGGRRGGNNEA